MNKKSSWVKGVPTEKSIYWWDSGFDKGWYPAESMILDMRGSGHVYGDGGSMPLSMVYSKFSKNAKYAVIDYPKDNEWQNLTSPSDIGENTRMWLKVRECGQELIGFGLMEQGSNSIYGTIIWKNHPTTVSTSGFKVVCGEDYCQFKIIKAPK